MQIPDFLGPVLLCSLGVRSLQSLPWSIWTAPLASHVTQVFDISHSVIWNSWNDQLELQQCHCDQPGNCSNQMTTRVAIAMLALKVQQSKIFDWFEHNQSPESASMIWMQCWHAASTLQLIEPTMLGPTYPSSWNDIDRPSMQCIAASVAWITDNRCLPNALQAHAASCQWFWSWNNACRLNAR